MKLTFRTAPLLVLLRIILLASGAVAIPSCEDDPTDVRGGCRPIDLNEDLVRVFYWGYDNPSNWTPNKGTPISGVRCPVWKEPDEILASTATFINGDGFSGLVAVRVDKPTYAYAAHRLYRHDSYILQCDWDRTSNELTAVDWVENRGREAFKGRLSGDVIDVTGVIAGPEWGTVSVAFWPGRDGVLAVAVDPATVTPGLFWFRPSGSTYKDSLIYALPDYHLSWAGVAVDADSLHAYVVAPKAHREHDVIKVRLDRVNEGERIFSRRYFFDSVAASPVESGALLISYAFPGDGKNPPGDIVEFVRPPYDAPVRIDARTHPRSCRFPTSGLISWDPSGRHMAFPSGAFSGEGDRWVETLWVLKDVGP